MSEGLAVAPPQQAPAPSLEQTIEQEDMTQGQLDESKGLLDAVSMEGPEPEPSPEDTIINHRSEDTSPIPEEVPAKFVKDNVVDIVSLAKSYKELEGKFRSNLHKVPEEGYDLSVATAAGVPEDDEVLKAYAGWAKEAGISQEYFNQLASTVLKNAGAQEAQSEFDAKAEIESLGPNAQAIIDDQVDWARKLVKTGTWGADDFEEFKVWGGTANGIRAIQKLRQFMGDTNKIPVNVNPAEDALPSEEECYQMVKDPRYQSDPSYRQKVEKIFARVFGTGANEQTIL